MPRRIAFEHRVLIAGVASFTPVIVAVAIMAFAGDFTREERWVAISALFASIALFIVVINAMLVYRLRTLSNLIGALREEDYSIRMRRDGNAGAMGELSSELDRLTAALRDQRLGALEAAALVRAVIAEIDSAIFAFDAKNRLQLVNRAGERLLARHAEQILGRDAASLGLAALLDGEQAETAEVALPGGLGRWLIRRSKFREKGVPHRLLVMSDLSRTLREEERLAWQRLLRVLTHELNNSLAPIRSIATSLQDLVTREDRPDDWLEDVRSGLAVIGSRTAGLNRFMDSYTKLARLPRPVLQTVKVAELITRAAALEQRMAVRVAQGHDVTIRVDPDQLEQLLINLIRNAVDASLEAQGCEVIVEWISNEEQVRIAVIDDGAGLSATANLFVPFFTTKPGGSGVGLALSRFIAEAHNGSLTLENRTAPNRGAIARLLLPR